MEGDAYDALKKNVSKGAHGRYCAKMIMSEELLDQVRYLQLLIDVSNTLIAHSNLQYSKECIDHDALTLFKMMSSKLSVVKRIVKEPVLTFDGILGDNMISHKIIDHVTLYAVIRTLFESLCVYELIYIFPQTKEEKELIYHLYQLAGTSDQYAIIPDKEKYKAERTQLKEEKRTLKKLIKETDLYRIEANKNIIKQCIDGNKFNIWVENGEVVLSQGYKGVIEHVGFNPNYIQGIYKYLCLNSHQTSVSVMQFHEACEMFNADAKQLIVTATRLAINLSSVFIVDFIKNNPDQVAVFNAMEDYVKYLVDAPNKLFRGGEYGLINFCAEFKDQ